MKVVFMGTPLAAAKSLEWLIEEKHEIAGVYTQPDRPSGRGKKIMFSPVKDLALRHKLKLFQPLKIKTGQTLEEFRSLAADIAVVVAYGRILPDGFLNSFPYGAINVHFSLLPKYRGAAPVNWAIVNGENETGVTTMKMDAGLDTGEILLQRLIAIGEDENAVELMERLSEIGADLLADTLKNLGTVVARKQDDSVASYAPILKKEDGLIDWKMTAIEIGRRVRGFQPFPSSYTFHAGNRITFWKAQPIESNANDGVGSIIEASGNHLVVSCGNKTALAITEIQPEGKRRMATRDFLNGANLNVGDVFESAQPLSEASNV